jgi:hypothetical protein
LRNHINSAVADWSRAVLASWRARLWDPSRGAD